MIPRVSVVVPSYNARDDFLEACLSSLELQTMPAWEAIVVDDGSTRGDVEGVVAKFGDQRLRTVRQENRGMGGARNTGFHAARAELVLTLDADDRIDPSFLDVAMTALDADADTDCVFMDSQRFGGDQAVWYFPDPLPPRCPQHPSFPDGGVLMRKRLWEGAGGYSQDRTLAGVEWWDFWLTGIERGMHVKHIAKPLYLYRAHLDEASVTSSMHAEYRNREQLYMRHKRTFDTFSGRCPRGPHSVAAFLAEGYVTSSQAAVRSGERRRALGLAFRAFLIYPWHRSTLRQFAQALVSGSLPVTVFRRLTRSRRARPKNGGQRDNASST